MRDLGRLPQRSDLLFTHDATAPAIRCLAALPRRHVAAPGLSRPLDVAEPLDSALLLAGDEQITCATCWRAIAAALAATRLAFLSACQTAITDFRSLGDEVIGALPAAFLQAGIPAVIGTLWPVNDRSTALLVTRFYELWREEGLEPPAALCAAQRWVRDTTNTEKADHFGRHFKPAGIKMAETVAAGFLSAALVAAPATTVRLPIPCGGRRSTTRASSGRAVDAPWDRRAPASARQASLQIEADSASRLMDFRRKSRQRRRGLACQARQIDISPPGHEGSCPYHYRAIM